MAAYLILSNIFFFVQFRQTESRGGGRKLQGGIQGGTKLYPPCMHGGGRVNKIVHGYQKRILILTNMLSLICILSYSTVQCMDIEYNNDKIKKY